MPEHHTLPPAPEPLVLLPGLMGDARFFGPQIAELSAEMPVMVAALTAADRIEDLAATLLDQLPARFALVGACIGGAVAMEVLRRAPERVTRIALMGTNPLAETPQTAANREAQIVAARAGRMLALMRDTVLPSWVAPGPCEDGLDALLLDMADALGPEVFVRQSRALQRRPDQQTTLRKCKVPALVLCGAEDRVTPPLRHEFMATLIPRARLHVLEGAAHLPALERPAQTTAALRDWLAQPSQTRAA